MRVTAVLKGNADDKGRIAIAIRTSIGQKRKHKNTNIRILKTDWDDDNMKIRSSHPQAAHLNTVIKKKLLEHELSLINGEIIIQETRFDKYVDSLCERWKNDKSAGTLRNYGVDKRKVIEYRPELKLSDITMKFLEQFKNYLQEKGDKPNTVWKTFKNIRAVVRQAIKDKLIKENPFTNLDAPKYSNPKTFFLTQSEVDRLEEYSIKPDTSKALAFTARWFVIGCYTGLRYGDMNRFSKDEHIRNGRLTLYTEKTGEIVSIKFTDRLKVLFNRVEYKPMHLHNEPFNRELKIIQKKVEIKIRLKVHVARHTFGVRCADAGIPVETTARLMGHTDIKTTKIYYKITNKRMDEDVKAIF